MVVARDAAPMAPFVEWLDDHGDETFCGMARDLWEEIPELRENGPEAVDALRASIRSHLPVLRAALRGSEPGPLLPSPAARFAQLMARSNTPLTALLRSYELGHATIWSAFTDHLRADTSLGLARHAEALEIGSIRLFQYIQAMTGQTVSAYNAVRDRLLSEASSRRSEIIRSVLAGTGGVRELHEFLGYHSVGNHVGYVAWAIDAARGEGLAAATRRRLQPLASQHVAVPAGAQTIHGWFRPAEEGTYRQLRSLSLPPGIRMAFGGRHAGLEGFRQTHEEAVLAAAVPPSREVRIPCFPDLAVVVLASQRDELAARFVQEELGPLIAHADRDRMLRTLRHYLETLASPTRSAQRLNVHPNTVTQRVQRIETVLGRHIDPSSLRLRLAVELAQFREEAEECQPAPQHG